MSKKANHWYILKINFQVWSKVVRPRLWMVGLWLGLCMLFLSLFRSGALNGILEHADSPAFTPVGTMALFAVVVAALLGFRAWKTRAFRAGYLRALKHDGPEQLVLVVESLLKGARVMPDFDAMSAQARANAYSLYGREEDATDELAEVDWSTKAPLIQAL